MPLERPILLSLNGGYVDTAGFLALQGLFTAHVTGNFVTLGAALVHSGGSTWAKLGALPLFCVVVMLVRWSGVSWNDGHPGLLRVLLGVKFLLLSVGCVLAIVWGPFADPDAAKAIFVGLTLVAAMAMQNALHRLHLGNAPPTTLMTGSTTQIMIDIVDLLGRRGAVSAIRARLIRMISAVLGFAFGCGFAALLFSTFSVWCFVVPPVVALATLLVPDRATHAASRVGAGGTA